MPRSRPPKLHTQRRQRWKKPPSLSNTRYWIHPRFGVGMYVEDSHALPARILIIRHTDGALSVATSSNFVRVTAVDDHSQDCEPEIYNIAENQTGRRFQTKMGNQSFGQILLI